MRKIRTLAISLLATAALSLPAQAFADVAHIEKAVNFRTQPSVSSDVIRYLKKNETVTILEKVNAYWLKVKDSSNRIGYLTTQEQYINIVPSSGSGSGSSAGSGSGSSSSASQKAQAVINAGKKYLGTPYEFGSSRSNTKTFDCSDFVRQAFLDALGLKLPADSRGQGAYVKAHNAVKTDWHQLKPGDLMFFMDYKGTKASSYAGINKANQKISHVGIYLGDGKILQTYSKQSGGVRIDSIAGKHWEYRFLYGGSAL